jgi:hypothetical protein
VSFGVSGKLHTGAVTTPICSRAFGPTTGSNASPAPTERWTLHIAKPFIAKIKAEAEAEHVTVTEVINRIIRHYSAGSSTSTSGEQVRFS